MATFDPMADRAQCAAKSKQSGKQCRHKAIPGGTVCRHHGGAAPQVKAKAEERLKALQDPALSRLEDILNAATRIEIHTKDGPIAVPLITASPSVVLGAAKTILDRTGLVETTKVEAEVTHHASDVDKELADLAAELRSRAEAESD